ncbi:hypothetical protein [Sporofaciens sp. JLR.KK001]|jgi:hypothetical protein|uniref:hypothetical protein n=1 Tax=Sporofaciens sp. JLR.KK001 TaxID=3112621 RepID=UPI002FF3EFCA
MKYIIYGVNRVAKDFLYMFEQLDILYFMDDTIEAKRFCGYEIKSIDDALQDCLYDQIIICDFEKEQKEGILQENGLQYRRDYIYEQDFFGELDSMSLPVDRKILVWGTGKMCHYFLGQGLEIPVAGFIDSYKRSDMFWGKPVFSPDEITDWKKYYVIIAVYDDQEIQKQLSEYGCIEEKDFVGYQKVVNLPSNMLKKTIFDKSYYHLECNTMFNHLEILDQGNTRCCCTTFVRPNLGNVLDKRSSEIWHSTLHRVLCLSTENRTFSFCDKSMCPLFVARGREESKKEDRAYKKLGTAPEVIALGYDPSCNLACSTCRKELYFAKGKELETINKITEIVKREYLPQCRFLILAGNGEVFASPAYREAYECEGCKPQYIRLLSNGMLFNQMNWERFMKGRTSRIMLTVSVDAASKETYESIRRNGNFDILKKNMEYASILRKTGELSYFRMNFVVQKENYKEMIPFVEWGQELGVDEIFFTKILNWGTYSQEEFEQISMMERDGITPKAELKEVLKHPVMNSTIVDLGTIQYAHKVDEADVVENYYMWELEKRGGLLFD